MVRKTVDEYSFRMSDGTPLKTIKVPAASAKCKFCGRKIRWITDEYGRLRPAEAKLQIVSTACALMDREEFLTPKGQIVFGVPVGRVMPGSCRPGFKVHKCQRRQLQ